MLKQLVDYTVSVFAPAAAVRRANARRMERSYHGAEANRLNNQARPKNQPADTELAGPFGADSLRAWARMLVRDNAYAWSALEAIVSETLGCGINVQSMLETPAGQDEEDTNENRDKTWSEWAEVCDVNGQLTFNEMQVLAFREMVEAGECLIHLLKVPRTYKGIYRPVPLALEIVEADRLAVDRDTFIQHANTSETRITRGVEMDQDGMPVAYWIYPAHPSDPRVFSARTPKRIPAKDIIHLFRKDRIGQSRGVTWYAPVVQWLRDLGLYVENEIQASAVASCFVTAIKTETPITTALPTTETSSTDSSGTRYEFLQPGLIMNLNPGESIESANPGRPNASSAPWIALMLQGIAAGTGTSYESVSKDFSNTSYSSSRTSKLENRPRYRRWQRYWMAHLCQPVWDVFCDAAALVGRPEFPTATELLDDRRRMAPVEFQPPEWEWVDITAEQHASELSINALQSTYADEIGKKGGSWRRNFYQRAKEEKLKKELGLVTPEQAMAQQAQGLAEQAQAQAMASEAQAKAPKTNGKPKVAERADCGTGAGGFKPGNSCAKGGGGVNEAQKRVEDLKKKQKATTKEIHETGIAIVGEVLHEFLPETGPTSLLHSLTIKGGGLDETGEDLMIELEDKLQEIGVTRDQLKSHKVRDPERRKKIKQAFEIIDAYSFTSIDKWDEEEPWPDKAQTKAIVDDQLAWIKGETTRTADT